DLARGGANIAINGRVIDEEARRVKAEVESFGQQCFLHVADVSRPADAVRCVEATVDALGGLDVLIHCAGGAAPGSLVEVTPEVWQQAFDIHVHAVFHLCRTAIPWMQRKSEGAIVLISSVAGQRGCAGAIAYGVAKGALPQFARSLARELADDNIRVNCVSPGIIRTRFQDHLTPEQITNNIEKRIPLHREGKPEDVSAVVSMLVCNNFITGENIVVDGGMAMRIA
ncbi:MAG: SDR family oxidoreductase, partial [Bryocella sp.]